MEQAVWLLQLAGTIVVFNIFIYILSGTKSFQGLLRRQSGWEDQVVLALLFGAFAILNTSLGVKLPSGAIVNVRDMSPMVAGLAGGPLILTISQPFSEALAVVTTIIVPMVVANGVGVAIAQQIIARRGYTGAGA